MTQHLIIMQKKKKFTDHKFIVNRKTKMKNKLAIIIIIIIVITVTLQTIYAGPNTLAPYF